MNSEPPFGPTLYRVQGWRVSGIGKLFRLSWCLLMRQDNLLTKCTEVGWLGKMTAVDVHLLCTRVEFRMLDMALLAKLMMDQIQINCKHCSRCVQEASVPLWSQQDQGRFASMMCRPCQTVCRGVGMYLGRTQCYSHDDTVDPGQCQAGGER